MLYHTTSSTPPPNVCCTGWLVRLASGNGLTTVPCWASCDITAAVHLVREPYFPSRGDPGPWFAVQLAGCAGRWTNRWATSSRSANSWRVGTRLGRRRCHRPIWCTAGRHNYWTAFAAGLDVVLVTTQPPPDDGDPPSRFDRVRLVAQALAQHPGQPRGEISQLSQRDAESVNDLAGVRVKPTGNACRGNSQRCTRPRTRPRYELYR